MPDTETVESLPIEPLGVSEAAEELNGLFAEPEPPEAAPETRPRGPDGKFLPRKPVEAEEPSGESDEEEEESDAEESDAEAPAPPVGRLLKVKVDGLEQEVPEEEVVKGYSRTADYTRKTQALAEERRIFEEREMAPTRQERQHYTKMIAQVEDVIRALMPDQEPDWEQLRNTMTPEQFTQEFTNHRAQQKRFEQIRAERERVEGIQEEDAQRSRQARLAEELHKLEAAIPDLADPEKGKSLRADLIAYARSVGFTDDELANVEDHRPLTLLHKARLWDESQKRRPTIETKVDRALDTMKPSGVTPKPKAKGVERAITQAAKSGRLEDAADAINQLLNMG